MGIPVRAAKEFRVEVTFPDPTERKDSSGPGTQTPLSPVFHGADGLYPIRMSNGNSDSYVMIYLTSNDYGKTWNYSEAYSLANRWAQEVQDRDGRGQYVLMSEKD